MKYSEMTKKILDNYSEGKKPPFSLTNDRQIRGHGRSMTAFLMRLRNHLALCFLRFSGSRNRKISLSKQ